MTPTSLLYDRLFAAYASEMRLTADQLRRLIDDDAVTMEDFSACAELKIATVEGFYDYLHREEAEYMAECREELKELKDFEKETAFLSSQGGNFEATKTVIAREKRRLLKILGTA